MAIRPIYVAATSQHVGKTTSTLGLVSALRARGLNVGYCKPLGQQFIDVGPTRVDKDAVLFAKFMDFELKPNLHSPVILGTGATTAYLDNPSHYNFPNRVLKASKLLEQHHDIVVYEGTGHPGVGSVVNLSNAHVAELLGAGLIMVVEAGIGNTIDKLALNLALFEQKNIPIIGVIINKAIAAKTDKVRHYVEPILNERGIRLLGIMPYEEELGLPVMLTITKALNGQVLYNDDQLDNKVNQIIAGSLIDRSELKNYNGLLLVVSVSRFSDALGKVKQLAKVTDIGNASSPLSGIILNGKGDISLDCETYIQEHKIPVVFSHMDTYESVIKISRIEVKINTRTPWKVKKAVEMFEEHVNLDPIFGV